MDGAKKAAIEKRAVIGLLIVFAVVFVKGPLGNLGLFKKAGRNSEAGPIPATEKVTMTKPIGQILKESWQMNDPQIEPQATTRVASAKETGPLYYTADEARDPMESLLPMPPSPSTPKSQGAVKESPPPPPPPILRIEGLLWGGPEPKAIINGAVYKMDDVVQGARILTIDRRGVTVEHFGTPVFYAMTSAPDGAAKGTTRQAHQWR